jgi:ferric-dicitrate binding protein FerR (iron transport regulator)
MTATLQEAIAAVRRGETERAQLLTAEVIRDNPDDTHAWYLLSQLVDSDARRAAYLSKVLALDPTHERARADLGARPTEDAPQPVTEFTPPATEAVAVAPESAPEWLQPLSPEPAPVAEAVTPLPVVAAPTPARPRPTPPPPPPPRQQGNSALTALLVLLALLTLAVLAILAYLLLF